MTVALHVPELAFVTTEDLVNELYARSSALLLAFTPLNAPSGNSLKVKIRGNSYQLAGLTSFANEMSRVNINRMLTTPGSIVELIPHKDLEAVHDDGDEDSSCWDDDHEPFDPDSDEEEDTPSKDSQ